MARVPYTPVPNVAAQTGAEGVSVNTPPAAFGANIGEALRGVGTTLQQSGDELFTRALALQDLRNQTDAREAQMDFATQSSKAHAAYSSLEGKAAVDGLQPYLDGQRQLQQSIRSKLTNPMAQRYYDQDSLPFLQRNTFSAAGHAADENKRWVVGTAQAGIDLQARTFTDPSNEQEFDAKLDRINRDADVVAQAHNWDVGGAEETDYKLKAASNLRKGQIMQIANTDPQKALELLDQHKGQMTEEDYNATLDAARARNRAVGTAVLANSIYDPDKSFQQMLDEGHQQVAKLSHGDPMFQDDFDKALRAKAFADRYAANQDTQNNSNSLHDLIVKGAKNMQQLLAMPGGQEAYDSLPAKIQAQVPGWINTYQHAVTEAVREQGDKRLTQLMGEKNNDVEQFLNDTIDVQGMQGLSQSQMRQVMTWRQQVLKNPNDDPRVMRAMSWMRGAHGSELDALGIMSRNENNKDDYDNYTGAMEAAIEAWTEQQKRPPSYKEIVDEIGPQIIKSIAVPGAIFGNAWPSQTPYFDVLQSQIQSAKDEAVKRGVEPPTDNEIRQAYITQMFQKLYGGSGGGQSAKPQPPGP